MSRMQCRSTRRYFQSLFVSSSNLTNRCTITPPYVYAMFVVMDRGLLYLTQVSSIKVFRSGVYPAIAKRLIFVQRSLFP